MAGGVWFRLDVGLLDDERFEAMNDATKGEWLVAYMLIKREGGAVKDLTRLERLMAKQGVADPPGAVARLQEAGWIVEHSKGGRTLRGYQTAQEWFRGPSDFPEAKATRNAKRPTTRAGRVVERVERPVERGGATPTNKQTNSVRSGARAQARTREEPTKTAHRKPGKPVPLKDLIKEPLPWEK